LASVLGIFTGLGKIGICALQEWILVPVSQLLLQSNVALTLMIFRFHSAFRHVLIDCGMGHDPTSCDDFKVLGR